MCIILSSSLCTNTCGEWCHSHTMQNRSIDSSCRSNPFGVLEPGWRKVYKQLNLSTATKLHLSGLTLTHTCYHHHHLDISTGDRCDFEVWDPAWEANRNEQSWWLKEKLIKACKLYNKSWCLWAFKCSIAVCNQRTAQESSTNKGQTYAKSCWHNVGCGSVVTCFNSNTILCLYLSTWTFRLNKDPRDPSYLSRSPWRSNSWLSKVSLADLQGASGTKWSQRLASEASWCGIGRCSVTWQSGTVGLQ